MKCVCFGIPADLSPLSPGGGGGAKHPNTHEVPSDVMHMRERKEEGNTGRGNERERERERARARARTRTRAKEIVTRERERDCKREGKKL